jgi:hypothetical protein
MPFKKFLNTTHKKTIFTSLLLLSLLFIVLRLPSLIEPYWYGDEGIYQVIGQAINNGQLLYRDIWDNKPPLLYYIYALANSDQITVRSMSLTAGVTSMILFYFLSLKLFKSHRTSFIITILYTLLFATPVLEGNIANAENFMLLPIIAAALFVIKSSIESHENISVKTLANHPLLLAGLLLGIAFIIKIVALFDLAAFALFLMLLSLHKFSWKNCKKAVFSIIPLIIGFVVPFVLTTCYFFISGIGVDYFQSVFSRNVDYVGFENAFLGIPQGLLIVKILLLLIAVGIIIYKRTKFSPVTLFITIWVVFAVFSANFSGRPYTHYVLVLLPSFCLLAGLAYVQLTTKRNYKPLIGLAALTTLVLATFPTYGVGKSFSYYQNSLSFLTGRSDLRSYQAFFDPETPRDYTIASFLKTHTAPDDTVFIWGDSAQIYVLANKLPPYKYTVSYHVKESDALLKETQETIDSKKPKYIVVLPESEPLPFSLPLYIIRFNVEGAIIYERSI